MRKTLIFFLFCISVITATAQTKAYINRTTKEFNLTADIKKDHKIFGYELPSANSKKLILFSVFTKDVDGNPNKCQLGSYYQTNGLKQGDKIMYISTKGVFVKLNYIAADNKVTTFYVMRKFVVFED